MLFSLFKENLDSDEFFFQKALGWALREYSKTEVEAVVTFIAATPLAPLSAREGLKWLRNQGRF
ncbi:MAG: DNA alkylation repair protein [Anaerolineaceae bacterium]|nr:DNA alkylation repair protein [Anaerolineaceae bacterium]